MNQRFYRLVLSGMLATGLTLCAAAAFAQDSSARRQRFRTGTGGGMGRRAPMSPDQQLAQMTTRYNLSADQQAKIKPILEDQAAQMTTMRSDTSMSRDDRMAKMTSLRTDSQTKIEAVLNDQQKQQYEADQQRPRRGGGRWRHGGRRSATTVASMHSVNRIAKTSHPSGWDVLLVNCGASPGKGRAKQEGESGFTEALLFIKAAPSPASTLCLATGRPPDT